MGWKSVSRNPFFADDIVISINIVELETVIEEVQVESINFELTRNWAQQNLDKGYIEDQIIENDNTGN